MARAAAGAYGPLNMHWIIHTRLSHTQESEIDALRVNVMGRRVLHSTLYVIIHYRMAL